ncbi:PAS domain-containing protein [Govanella unica]|uniref:PAS domain-containing protein n=1 Tax=Govanella unica TaxID=2975056 RepID=A0A9X3TUD7_9PROT|nr:PAS domain-containing protein [Govania unica]MDA5192410.1 PAS domain-containing protein [Govania unica]
MMDAATQTMRHLPQDSMAERRLCLRFFTLWENLAAGRAMPALQDFTASSLAPFKNRSLLIDLQDGPEGASFRYVGERIATALAVPLQGAPLDAVPAQNLLTHLIARCPDVIANRAPITFDAEVCDREENRSLPYRAVLAPLSRDGDHIDFLIGVLSWRQTSTPLDLGTELTQLRETAQSAGRTRAALYDLLVRIHGFASQCAAAPEELAVLLRDSGIRTQKRARETAILKLVFGKDHDKTRLTEYAAALALATREDLDSAAFHARLTSFSGGLKAMVRAERQARNPGTDAVVPEVLATLPDWRPNPGPTGEELTLRARRTGDGQIEIIGVTVRKIS